MRLIANRQLSGAYGVVTAGQVFECDDEIARTLMENGVAYRPQPPRILYQTKVVRPEAPEVGPRPPFRDLPLPNAEPKVVSATSNPVLPGTDVPESRASNPVRWGGRKGSSS